MNEWTNEQTNERTNERTNKRTNERTNEQTNERTNEWMNAWMNEWMIEWMNELLWIYRLNWAKITSWTFWDQWDDTMLQTQDAKFEPSQPEVEHDTSWSRNLPTILKLYACWVSCLLHSWIQRYHMTQDVDIRFRQCGQRSANIDPTPGQL